MSLREEFYNKLSNDYEEYIKGLKTHDVDFIIEKSYETSIKDEMMCYFEPSSKMFSLDKIKLLNKSKHPLEEMYLEWINCDLNIGDELKECINEYVFFLQKNSKIKGMDR